MKRVNCRAYSSSANLASGYDILAVCLGIFYDEIQLEKENGTGKVSIISNSGVPSDPYENTAGIAVQKIMADFGISDDLKIILKKGVPLSSGLGGSAASSVAAVTGMNELYGLELDQETLVHYAAQGEKATGSIHYDNVSASLYGQATMVLDEFPVKVERLNLPDSVSFLIVLPEARLKSNTEEMRRLLPHEVSMRDHTQNSRYLASLLHGLAAGNREAIKFGLDDLIVQPARSVKYPYFDTVRKTAKEHDALGAYISGSGPSVAIMIDAETDLNSLKASVEKEMLRYNMPCSVITAGVEGGARIEQ